MRTGSGSAGPRRGWPEHPALLRFKALRCSTLEQVRSWVDEERRRDETCASGVLAANAALSLLNLACYLLDRQVAAQAEAFKQEGGFTERLYRVRTASRAGGGSSSR